MAADISLLYASFVLTYSPLPRLESTDLPELYAELRKTFNFATFEQEADSHAVMLTEDERRLELDRTQLLFEEGGEALNDFDSFVESAEQLVGLITNRFMFDWGFRVSHVRLRGVGGVLGSDPHLSTVIQERLLKISSAQYNLLGQMQAAGVNLYGRDSHQDFDFELHIAPHFGDPHVIYVESTAYPLIQMSDQQTMRIALLAAHRFLFRNVVPFLETFLPSE